MGFQISLLSSNEVDVVFDKVLKFLSERGVKIQHKSLLKTLGQAGAWVDSEKETVRFPRNLVEDSLKKVPHRFTLAGVDPRFDIPLPSTDGNFYTCTNTGARGMIDPETGIYRELRISDVENWARLVDLLDHIDMCAFPTPTDAPPQTADLHSLKALLENTSKHIWIQPHGEASLGFLIDLVIAKAGGEENLKKRPIASIISDAMTPFGLKSLDGEIILQSCRYGIPIHASTLPVAGATSPITLMGSVIVAGIEVLMQLVIAQIVKPGIPVIGLSGLLNMDMLTGKTLKASVQAIQGNAVFVQFMREAYHIPTHCAGFTTDSPIPDGQSMIERNLRALMISAAGSDIMGRAGELAAAKTISPIQLIIDNEVTGMLRHLKSGVEFSEETMAWDVILAVPPGGHFLDQKHTLDHCREGFRPQLFVRNPAEWSEMQGGKDLLLTAQEKYKELAGKERTLTISGQTLSEMNRIVQEADRALVR
jgi:trimethylamine:corrinoid methyltransferase-like protein